VIPVSASLEGIQSLQKYFRDFPEVSARAARDTVNKTAAFGYADSSRFMREQINFDQNYIGSFVNGNRLIATQKATTAKPVAVIEARQRPVSLARYAASRDVFGKAGVRVKVRGARGGAKMLKSGFLVKLRKGKARIEDGYNIGLVVRMPKGVPLANKYKFAGKPYSDTDPDLYLLYGPSVDQVFKSVRDQVAPRALDYMTREFLRNFERYARG